MLADCQCKNNPISESEWLFILHNPSQLAVNASVYACNLDKHIHQFCELAKWHTIKSILMNNLFQITNILTGVSMANEIKPLNTSKAWLRLGWFPL